MPSNLLVLAMFVVPPLLDACNASPLETRVSFGLLVLGTVAGIFFSMFVWDDHVIHRGFKSTVDINGNEVWTGQFTKNGLRIGVFSSLLSLLLGSLVTAFAYDGDHSRMYFVKVSVKKV